jgi:undecaprenyl-diphosphatase
VNKSISIFVYGLQRFIFTRTQCCCFVILIVYFVTMQIFQILILGAVEGLTEFLPISSTAHLMLASRIMGLASTDFLKTFEIIVQFGAILAVVVLYWPRFSALRRVWSKLLAAFIPTGIIGFILYRLVKGYLLGNNTVAVWALGIGGVLLILFEIFHKDKNSSPAALQELAEMSYVKAMAIGFAQAVAIIPGVSRSAATIVAGRALGVSRAAIVEFSFLLAVPTMLAAAGYDLLKSAPHLDAGQYGYLLIGLVAAFVTAHFSVRWLLRYVQSHNFTAFGVYRIIMALVFIPFL